MITTTLSTKGQIIIPKEVRRQHGWDAGLVLELVEQEDGIVLRPLRAFPRTTVDDVLGCLAYKGPRKTLADMDAGIAKGAKKSR